MLHSRRRVEFMVVAVFVLCTWFLFDARLNRVQKEFVEAGGVEKPERLETAEVEGERNILGQRGNIFDLHHLSPHKHTDEKHCGRDT
jgi:hypothetical protein